MKIKRKYIKTVIISIIIVILIGLAGGLAVGAGFVAFIAVLGIIPRLMQLTKSLKMTVYYEWAVISGAVICGWISLQEPVFSFSVYILLFLGGIYGIFVGMLAAALYEVVNVFPVLFKRVHLNEQLLSLIMALVFGKIFGSLFHWLYYINFK